MEFCEERGIEPQAIRLKVLVPLLDNMSLEDNPETSKDPEGAEAMHERWAALLANAAMGEDGAEVMPGFPRILSELTPEEATMLEWLAKQSAGSTLDTFKAQVGYDWTKPKQDQKLFDVYVDNLERLQLISVSREDRELLSFQRNVAERLKKMDGDPWTMTLPRLDPRSRSDSVRMTPLGRAFVAACRPPAEAVETETAA